MNRLDSNIPLTSERQEEMKKQYMQDNKQTASTMQEEFERGMREVFESLENDIDNPQIDNPTHYQSIDAELSIDAISCMRAAFGKDDTKAFCLCNAMKYIFRSSSKGQNTDIGKAIWYLNKFLELGGYE